MSQLAHRAVHRRRQRQTRLARSLAAYRHIFKLLESAGRHGGAAAKGHFRVRNFGVVVVNVCVVACKTMLVVLVASFAQQRVQRLVSQ